VSTFRVAANSKAERPIQTNDGAGSNASKISMKTTVVAAAETLIFEALRDFSEMGRKQFGRSSRTPTRKIHLRIGVSAKKVR